jgi:hypothetical protein
LLSLAAPWWLLGLALLPVIRWLHRGGRHRRALPVAHLGLWRAAAARSPAAGEKQPPDPAWRRRALLAALLLLALAEPRLPPPQRAVTLWVDDSLSMLTREAQGTRLALALAQAGALLAERPGAEVEVRVLGDPWQPLGQLGAPPLTPAAAAAVLGARIAASSRPEPAAPPAALLRADREHWLLTDGAHPALQKWPDGWPADRVVQVGEVTRNLGLATLAARRSPDDADRVDVIVKLSNGGDADETRELVIDSGAPEPLRSSHSLEPGAAVLVTVQVAVADRVRATLQPGDALAADDELVLDLAPLRRHRVAVDAGCAAALRAAVAAHPALAQVAPGAADLAAVLDCGGATSAGKLPALRVLDGDVPRRPPGPVQWPAGQPASQRIQVEPGQLPVAATLKPQPGDTVLLAAGDEPVVIARAAATPLVETSLDFGALSTARGPQTPLLVNLAFERLLGVRLLGEIATAGRGTAASFVAPRVRAGTSDADPTAAAPARTPPHARAPADGTRPVLWLALLALLWEIAALTRQGVRLGRQTAVGPT